MVGRRVAVDAMEMAYHGLIDPSALAAGAVVPPFPARSLVCKIDWSCRRRRRFPSVDTAARAVLGPFPSEGEAAVGGDHTKC